MEKKQPKISLNRFASDFVSIPHLPFITMITDQVQCIDVFSRWVKMTLTLPYTDSNRIYLYCLLVKLPSLIKTLSLVCAQQWLEQEDLERINFGMVSSLWLILKNSRLQVKHVKNERSLVNIVNFLNNQRFGHFRS